MAGTAVRRPRSQISPRQSCRPRWPGFVWSAANWRLAASRIDRQHDPTATAASAVVGVIAASARLTWRLTVGRPGKILVISITLPGCSYGRRGTGISKHALRHPAAPAVGHLQRLQRYVIVVRDGEPGGG
jgi:hypothetical protein